MFQGINRIMSKKRSLDYMECDENISPDGTSYEDIVVIVKSITCGILFGDMSDYQHTMLCHYASMQEKNEFSCSNEQMIYVNNIILYTESRYTKFLVSETVITEISMAIIKDICSSRNLNRQYLKLCRDFDAEIAEEVYLSRSFRNCLQADINIIKWKIAGYAEIELTDIQQSALAGLHIMLYSSIEELCAIMHDVSWESVD
jgi:hypothetical protein